MHRVDKHVYCAIDDMRFLTHAIHIPPPPWFISKGLFLLLPSYFNTDIWYALISSYIFMDFVVSASVSFYHSVFVELTCKIKDCFMIFNIAFFRFWLLTIGRKIWNISETSIRVLNKSYLIRKSLDEWLTAWCSSRISLNQALITALNFILFTKLWMNDCKLNRCLKCTEFDCRCLHASKTIDGAKQNSFCEYSLAWVHKYMHTFTLAHTFSNRFTNINERLGEKKR